MIQMICGACRTKDGLKRSSDKPFCLSFDEEKRLVGRGVARYVIEPDVAENTPKVNDSSAGMETGHLDIEQLRSMTNAQLKTLAEGMNLDVSKCKKKDDFINAISKVDVFYDQDEAPPVLDAEDIVNEL